MKKEKEQRATARLGSAAKQDCSALAKHGSAALMREMVQREKVATTPSATVVASPQRGDGVEPAAKRARVEPVVESPHNSAASASQHVGQQLIDAAVMPPPPTLPAKPAKRSVSAAQANLQVPGLPGSPAALYQSEVETKTPCAPTASAAIAAIPTLAKATVSTEQLHPQASMALPRGLAPEDGDACAGNADPLFRISDTEGFSMAAQGAPDEEHEVGEPLSTSGLPEGFFDDPDLDAKVRGVEAPSDRAQRNLEEGLKRFEKEMLVEAEKAEEARHEIDEERYEQVAAEEDAFQRTLEGRLEELRKRRGLPMASMTFPSQRGVHAAECDEDSEEAEEAASAIATTKDRHSINADLKAAGAAAEREENDGGSSSDGDVQFDWRSKDFG